MLIIILLLVPLLSVIVECIILIVSAIRHKESNWAKFLMQDLKDAVFAPEHLFHKVSGGYIE